MNLKNKRVSMKNFIFVLAALSLNPWKHILCPRYRSLSAFHSSTASALGLHTLVPQSALNPTAGPTACCPVSRSPDVPALSHLLPAACSACNTLSGHRFSCPGLRLCLQESFVPLEVLLRGRSTSTSSWCCALWLLLYRSAPALGLYRYIVP